MNNHEQPNIILYISDQQRQDCVGAYGNDTICTPNIDRLARDGTRFTNMYSQFPLCGPSRACFITGQYPQAHSVYFNGVPIPAHAPRLPRALQACGYRTAQVGLFNIEPRAGHYHGYDVFRFEAAEYPEWAASRGYPGVLRHGEKRKKPREFYGALDYPAEHHAARWVADTSIEVMEQEKDAPFFLEINERFPHLPYVAPEPYATMYDPDEVYIAPSVSREREDFQSIKEMHAIYYGMISLVDESFGRVLDAVDRLGIADNTVVIFTTDHGDMIGHHDDWAKWALYDDDARLPFIMRYPDHLQAGSVIDGLVEQIDLFPTIADLAGADVPRGVQGKSIMPILEGGECGKDAVFGYQSYDEYPAGIRECRQMVRTKSWKLIHKPYGESLLFNMEKDPHEMTNLYGDTEYREIEYELKDRLLRWHIDASDVTIPSLFVPGQSEDAKNWIETYLDPCSESSSRSSSQ
jgi:arylsulfatase